MGGGAEADDGFAGLHEVGDVLRLCVRQDAPAGEENHHVGGLQGLQSGNIVTNAGIDDAGGGVDGEEDGAFEAMLAGEDFRELGQGLCGVVFLIAGHEDDVFAEPGARAALKDHAIVGRHQHGGRQGEGEECRQEALHVCGLSRIGQAFNSVCPVG